MKLFKNRHIFFMGSSLIFMSSTYIFSDDNTFNLEKLYGKLEYTFLQEDDSSANTSSISHLQTYQVGYRSFYYSPKFFKYDLSGTLYINNTTTDIANKSNEQNIKSFNYKANLDFIQGSKYPFTIFAEKSDIPFVSLLSTNTLYSSQDISKYGLHGSMSLLNHMLNYSFSVQDIDSKYLTVDEKRKDTIYSIKLYRNLDKSNYSMSFTHSKRDYERTDLRDEKEVNKWKDDFTELNANWNWNPSKVLHLRTYLKYSDSEYMNLKTTTASTNLNWIPTKKYSANFGAIAENLTSSSTSTNYVSLYAGGNYKITSHLSTNHYLTLFSLKGDDFTQQSGSLKLGLAYRNKINNTMTYYMDGDVEGKIEKGSRDTGDDFFLNRNSTAYNTGFGFLKKLQKINSTLNLGMRYYLYNSDIGEKISRYTLSGSFLTKFNGSFNNSLSITYSKTTNNYDYEYYSSPNNPSSSTEILVITERINYNKTLGIKGKLNANIGIRHYISETGDTTNPFANINLNYLLWNNLIFKSGLWITNDLYSGYTNYTATMGLEYRIGQILLLAGARYLDRINSESDKFEYLNTADESINIRSTIDKTTYGRKNFYFQLRRIF